MDFECSVPEWFLSNLPDWLSSGIDNETITAALYYLILKGFAKCIETGFQSV